jgi:hypothetical protein
MWAALFNAITAGFGFFGNLIGKKTPAATNDEPVNASAARAGSAAGAAAYSASKSAGSKVSK